MHDLSSEARHLANLIRCPSITPEEGGALSYLDAQLSALGFEVTRRTFSSPGSPDVENLYARYGNTAPNFCFAGHTDVVPPGNHDDWSSPPFDAEIANGIMIGRGAVDMKGGIACFLAACESLLNDGWQPTGSISLLITGDEEGPAINGTSAILDWLVEQGEQIDACLVGEPTNPDRIGDAIKIGRRGSVSGTITVSGIQGHAAYPHLADNPLRGLTMLVDGLMAEKFDSGTDDFQPTNLEVTSMDTGNPSFNVIPAEASAKFNIRFNDIWTAASVKDEIVRRLDNAASDPRLRQPVNGENRTPVAYRVEWTERPSHVFLTRDEPLINALSGAVETVIGQRPELSTGGGTSDARFIKDVCPVVEFGLVGQTMHQIDERVPLSDLQLLTEIYRQFLRSYFIHSK